MARNLGLRTTGTLGVLDEANTLIEKTTRDAYAHLHALPHTPARDMLEELAHNLVARRT